MKRSYFNRFYLSTILCALGGICIYLSFTISNEDLAPILSLFGNILLSALGVFLLYRGHHFVFDALKTNATEQGSFLISVLLIASFGLLVALGLITGYLAFIAVIIGPLYAFWNLYKYLTFQDAELSKKSGT